MSFIDRILASDGTKLSPHLVGSLFWSLHRGKVTRARMIAELGLEGDDLTELDIIIDHYLAIDEGDPFLTALAKSEFAQDVREVPILVESGVLTTNADIRNYLGV